MISRRAFFGMLGAAGALAASDLMLPKRSIFLPPIGGWPHGRIPHASLIIPERDAHYWAEEIRSGKAEYDRATQMMSWYGDVAPPPSAEDLEWMKSLHPGHVPLAGIRSYWEPIPPHQVRS